MLNVGWAALLAALSFLFNTNFSDSISGDALPTPRDPFLGRTPAARFDSLATVCLHVGHFQDGLTDRLPSHIAYLAVISPCEGVRVYKRTKRLPCCHFHLSWVTAADTKCIVTRAATPSMILQSRDPYSNCQESSPNSSVELRVVGRFSLRFRL
jgi:hypothetical protein